MPVDRPHGTELIDFDRLRDWMDFEGLGSGPISAVTPLTGGSQNVIVRFKRDGRDFVLRRPPAHPTADGNETMRREARVLGALTGSIVPHPRLIAACSDEAAIGAAFYLMEPVEGFNPGVGLPDLHAGDPKIRHRMGLAMADAIAALASVDYRAAGLEGFGNPDGFLDRQVERWQRQLDGYRRHEGWPGPAALPNVAAIASWLDTNRPSRFVPGILHGDFHLKNVLFRNDGSEIAAVIDWELATIGDPMLDLGWLLATWRDQGSPSSEAQIVVEPWDGFPTPAELVARYGVVSGRDVSQAGWYAVLAWAPFVLPRTSGKYGQNGGFLPFMSHHWSGFVCTFPHASGASWGQIEPLAPSRKSALPPPMRIPADRSGMRMEIAMPLSDTALRALKPMERRYKKADQRGLYIEVEPNGSKLWRYKYRFEGLEKRIALGRYPDVSLSQARRKQEDARRLLEDGKDPSLERRRERLVASINAENTFGGIAREYIQHKMIGEQRAEVTVAKARWLLEQLNPLANMPVAEIRPAEVLGALRRIEAKGKYETARRCRSFASRVFRYAVATCRAEHDPSAVLRGALITPKVTHHSALTDPKAIGELLRAIDEYPGSMITRMAMQIMPHVMCRPGELRQAEWREFDFDAAIWTIPPGRMKMRQPHAVPLSKQVLGYLDQLHALTGPSGFVFPAFHTFKRPMSENTINQAFRRMGYTSDEMTAHGWRTTASTLLNESGKWNPDAIERSLAHADPNAVRGTYNRGRYWAERVEMHRWWSDYLDQLRKGADILRPAFGRGSGPYSNLSQFKSPRATDGAAVKR